MTTKKNTQKTINLTEKEAQTLKTILEGLVEELKARELKTSTTELLETYAKELDLSGDSRWLAEEIAKELVENGLDSHFYNELVLVKVVYQEGVEGCDHLLSQYCVRGLWDSIRERRNVLVSTMEKVDSQLEYLEEKFTEGLGFELPKEPEDKTVLQEFTPRKIEELVQGTKVSYDELDVAIYTMRDFGDVVGYTKEGFIYIQTLLGDKYLTPEEFVKMAKEEYKAAELEED